MKHLQQRPYQVETINDCLESFGRGVPSVMIFSPTGSGKTVMGLSVVKRIMAELGATTCNWVAKRRKLLKQAGEENLMVGATGINFISMFDKDVPEADILVVDEAHADATASMTGIHSMTKAKYVLGLSATPFRNDGARLCFAKTIRYGDFYNLIHQGYLSKYNHFSVGSWKPTDLARAYDSRAEEFGKSVVFFLTMAECQEFCTVMNAMGHDSETIHGGMNEEEKENLFDRFDRGEVKVLVNIILLTEGFDCPDLQTVFVRPTESKGLGIQMAGRVLRLHQGKIKNIVECSSVGKNNFVRTAKPVEQYVLDGNEWHCISSNDAIETVSREMISAIVNNTNTTGDSMAALLKKKMKGKKKRSF